MSPGLRSLGSQISISWPWRVMFTKSFAEHCSCNCRSSRSLSKIASKLMHVQRHLQPQTTLRICVDPRSTKSGHVVGEWAKGNDQWRKLQIFVQKNPQLFTDSPFACGNPSISFAQTTAESRRSAQETTDIRTLSPKISLSLPWHRDLCGSVIAWLRGVGSFMVGGCSWVVLGQPSRGLVCKLLEVGWRASPPSRVCYSLWTGARHLNKYHN